MHEPTIAAASAVSSVMAVAAQTTCAPTAAFRMRYPIAHTAHVIAPPSALPCSGRGVSAPGLVSATRALLLEGRREEKATHKTAHAAA